MRYLADTHVLLWLVMDSPRLSQRHRQILAGPSTIFYSSVSVAEIAIKLAKRRLPAPPDLFDAIPASGLDELPFRSPHAVRLRDLPPHHRDPFDRMLIAQAQEEGVTILTVDPHFAAYDVEIL